MSQKPSREDLTEVRHKVRLFLSVGRFDAAEKLLRATIGIFSTYAIISTRSFVCIDIEQL